MPELTLSEEFFYNIFAQAGDGIFLISPQSTMIEVNPRGCEILGYSREELIGQPVLKFQPPDEIEHILAKLAQLATDRLVTTESVFLRKDGSRVPVEITGNLLSNNQIIGLLRDITERKLAEQALIESEQQFRTLVEHSPDGITVVDENGYIVEWNTGQEEITGLLRGETIGRPVWEIQYRVLPEELRWHCSLRDLKQKALDILGSGRGPGLGQPNERIFQRPDGTCRNVEIMTYSYQTKLGFRVGSIARDITRRKQVEMLLEYMATHDALTDLPNRQLLQDRLEVALERIRREQRGMLAFMMLDLDHFKEVNDSSGHACGDQLLKIVAKRLQGCMRKSDTVARMGGDEFALIMEEVTDFESSKLIAQKVLDAISQDVEIEGQLFKVTASIGISLHSCNGNDAASLFREADLAMYHAKRTRNCYQFYDYSYNPELPAGH
jgi:diguanylate cyclase (GGDEF)-like protein/PAS domain S-box-containing protein